MLQNVKNPKGTEVRVVTEVRAITVLNFLTTQVQPAMESANPLHQRAAYQAIISNIVQKN